ncbi:TldD/PmbA family protein [Haliangium sp.]|uniref:TldD/PmbA family protein n=1 Tax=Haliangium sp. TaxID=2663208 RepID=UPI003D0FABD8
MNRLHNWWPAVLVTLWIPLAGCPKPQGAEKPPIPDIVKADPAAPARVLPEVPVEIDTVRVEPGVGHDPAARAPILDIMLEENQRWMEVLGQQREAPAYFVSYQIYDRRAVVLETDGGALVTDSDTKARWLDVEVRAGSPRLDNRHTLSDEQQNQINAPRVRRGVIPFGADEQAVRNHLWLETDRRYREAKLALGVVRLDKSVTAQDDAPPDFVKGQAETFIQPVAALDFDKEAWIERLRACSRKAFRGVATRATCRVDFELDTSYYVNSEGTVLQQSQPNARIMVSVGVKADDGMPLGRLEQRFARTPADLPDDAELDQLIATVTRDLDALHAAPIVDPYVGPAILEGRAAAVFFHEVFGHRIEGHRQKERTSGQTFASKVGERIMPPWITVYDDPTVSDINGIPLNGFYRFDDEGVPAQRALLVDDGVLEGFIMGRNPIEGFGQSNGHGRKEPGRTPVSRQGNLIVEAARTLPAAELEAALIDEVRRQGKPFGMVFTDISGGFTNTTRFLPQAFKVNPVMAYRVYPDGRRELVRGVDIVGTPLTALGSIVAASREVESFNGTCGAESGWVPVSASAPSLLLESLEIERGYQGVDRPPVLPPPSIGQTRSAAGGQGAPQ